MSYCLNPDCTQPNNPPNFNYCLTCGTDLILEDRYIALKVIGQGGFGRTFLAIDTDKPTKTYCVIKQFYPQVQGVEKLNKAALLFEQEALRLAELGKHPCIPELYTYSVRDKHQYLVQEWIEGDNLDAILHKEGVFKEAQIRHLLNSVLPILDFIHSHYIIHRDIKPENIILRQDKTFALVDFGAAKVVNKAILKTGTIIGSPEYIAPEQLRGKAIFGSDIYSLGVTCIHLLTQVSPFELFSDSSDRWVWQDYLVENSLSYSLSRIIDKMIAKAIDRRYQSTQQILQDLNPNLSIIDRKITPDSSDSDLNQDLILVSTTGINYTELSDLLNNNCWQQANETTAKLLLQIGINRKKNWLERDDIENLPCEDLQIIDRLWREYSQDRFGFSIQANIWQNIEQPTYQYFGEKVGWRVDGRWILFQKLNFSLSAPIGHLPAMNWWFGHAIWGLKTLFLRLDACCL